MKLKIENPNITQFNVKAEPGDFFYGKCNWAKVAFDSDSWRMSATSDSGDFSYTWSVEHGDRTFLMLMSEIDRQYLLDKISSLSQFDLKETKESFIANNELNEEQKQFVNGLRGISSAEIFIDELEESELFEHWSEAYEYIQYDYPTRAKAFADVFINAIQPAIKELITQPTDEETMKIDVFLAVSELQGVKEEMQTITAELERKGFDEPKGFSTLAAFIEDRQNDLNCM